MQREIFSNAHLSAYDRVLANDEKIRTYPLPESLQGDGRSLDSHHEQLEMILFQRAFLTILIHASRLGLHRQ
jgi:hypothetical protein